MSCSEAYGDGVDRIASALAPLPSGYRALLDRLLTRARDDERIRGVWLSGSLARGAADAASDLDVLLAVSDGHVDDFSRRWREWLDSFAEPLTARAFPGAPRGFYCVTTSFERLDVVIEEVGALPQTRYRTRLTVLDRDALDALVPPPDPEPGPDLARIEWIVEELFRLNVVSVAGVLTRGDLLLGVAGVATQRQLLHDLFVEGNRPLPTTGVKHWSSKLTEAQREGLRTLPPVRATRASFVTAIRANTELLRTLGREVAERQGLAWPEDLDRRVTAHFNEAAD